MPGSSWGIATNRIDVVKQAMTQLPAAESTPAQLHRLNAWLAAKQGDVAAERRELELLVEADPADLTALDRLAELAEKDGQPAAPPSCGGKRPKSIGCELATSSCTSGNSRFATRWKWPAWRSSLAGGSRPEFFVPSPSSTIQRSPNISARRSPPVNEF